MERVKIETRRFAKAQRTWLKRYRDVFWLEPESMPSEQIFESALGHVCKDIDDSS